MKVGLIQQKNSADIKANIAKLQDNIRKAAAMGAELVVLQELHNGLYFCQTENTQLFDKAESIPILLLIHLGSWPKSWGLC